MTRSLAEVVGATWRERSSSSSLEVSVDVGTQRVKFVESQLSSGRVIVRKAGFFETPPGAIASGIVCDPRPIGDALRQHLKSGGFRATRATICIPAAAAVLKRVRLGIGDIARLKTVVDAEIQNLTVVGSEALCVDYHVSEALAHEMLDVLVVAARKETVQRYVAVLERAGLEPRAVDVDCLAVANLIDVAYGVDPTRTAAFVHAGATFGVLGVRSHGSWVFTGNVGIDAGPPRGLEAIVHEVDNALKFYWPASAGDRIDELVISGGMVHGSELKRMFAEHLGCTVSLLQLPSCSAKLTTDSFTAADSLDYAVAAGLAVRGLETS